MSTRTAAWLAWSLCGLSLTLTVVALLLLAQSIYHFSAQYAIFALLAQPTSLPAGEALAWVFSWLLPIIIGLSVFLILLFPTGRLPSRRWRWVTWPTVAFILVGAISDAFFPGPVDGLGPIRNPLGIEGFSNVYTAILFNMVPTVLLVAAASSVFVRLRRAIGVERQQIKYAILLSLIPAIPISIGIAILKYRLYDIDIIINRTLVYGSLTATLGL